MDNACIYLVDMLVLGLKDPGAGVLSFILSRGFLGEMENPRYPPTRDQTLEREAKIRGENDLMAPIPPSSPQYSNVL